MASLIDPAGRPIASPAAQSASSGSAGANPHIKDSSLATFGADVIQASRQQPVIVDFWAPWCGPCKQLGPVLEKLVGEANGAVKMVKVNIDENPEIAQQLRIQSIPTVYAFRDGQPVDGFMGAIPESQARSFIQNLIAGAGGHAHDHDHDHDHDHEGHDHDHEHDHEGHHHGGPEHTTQVLAAAGEALSHGDVGEAAQLYAHALQDEPGHPKAVAGLAKCYLLSGDVERAKKCLGLVRPDSANDEAIRAVEAELKLKESAAGVSAEQAGKVAELRAKLSANAADHQARYDLALALDGAGDREGSIGELLDLIRRDRKWNEEAAKKQLLTLFEAMGPTDPRTLAARRQLSSILFS